MPSKVKRRREDVDGVGDVPHQQVATLEGAHNRKKDKILQMCRAENKEVLVELTVKTIGKLSLWPEALEKIPYDYIYYKRIVMMEE